MIRPPNSRSMTSLAATNATARQRTTGPVAGNTTPATEERVGETRHPRFQNNLPLDLQARIARLQPSSASSSATQQLAQTRLAAASDSGKLPKYLGIFATGNAGDVERQIKEYIISGLELAKKTFHEDRNIVDCLNGISRNGDTLNAVEEPHITTFFIGKNTAQAESEQYKSFEIGRKTEIDVSGMAIVPGKIATGICFPDQSIIKIENEFPHITLMTGSWEASKSNDLLAALFRKGGPLNAEWSNRDFKELNNGFAKKFQLKVGDEVVTAYVVKPSTLSMHAETRAQYSA